MAEVSHAALAGHQIAQESADSVGDAFDTFHHRLLDDVVKVEHGLLGRLGVDADGHLDGSHGHSLL